MALCPSVQAMPASTRYAPAPQMAASRMSAVVTIQIVAMVLPYGTIIMTIAWIAVSQVEAVAVVIGRSYVEVRVRVIIPRSPRVV